MNIDKELFKEEVSELDSFDLNDFTLNPFDWDEENQKFYFNPTQLMWEVWQAAKAQAVPEGFGDIQSWIAVNSFSALDAVHENVPIIDANELAKYIDNLIEAQDQSHD